MLTKILKLIATIDEYPSYTSFTLTEPVSSGTTEEDEDEEIEEF
jgi:hypothetical protein